MHVQAQLEALSSGKIDVGFTRPLEQPYDRTLSAELLYRDPVVVAMPRTHRLAGKRVSIAALAAERFVMCERRLIPSLFDSILALCSSAGFSPEIVHQSSGWPSVLTLVESGEGIALVPSGVRYLATPGLVFCEMEPETLHAGISIAWNPDRETPIVKGFLDLVRQNKDRIQKIRQA
jgi:DNA-binding transcriptional LysR family regulator